MSEQNCAARKALEACVSLFENWRDGHFSSLGIRWEIEPPAIVGAREALAAPCEHAAEVERLRTACDGAEFAIRQCVALKEWGPSTPEHLASRVATLCNLYAGCVDTLGKIADQRDQLCAELDTMKAERQDTGVGMIAAERKRQVSEEGWTPEHDDQHVLAELSRAASSYTILAARQVCDPATSSLGSGWPWNYAWWKPSSDSVRNLVKAGALIAAEIDRLKRAATREQNPEVQR